MPNNASASSVGPVIAQGLYSFQIGGSERIGSQLAIEYSARGYPVICFAVHGTHGPFREQLESRGIECVDLNYLKRSRLVRRATYAYELRRFFRQRNVHALHLQHAIGLNLCGAAAHRAGVRRVVMSEHDIFQLDGKPAYRQEAARNARFASAITGVHAGITDYFRDHLAVSPDLLTVIPNGVPSFEPDATARARMRESLSIAPATFVCVYVGRLEAVKDLQTLLRAAAALPEEVRRRSQVLLVGDGSERASLELLQQSLGLGDLVRFMGARTDIQQLLNMADAFVMTSSTEGLPMALLEAMAAGLPCVATAVGGIPATLAEDAGITVPAADPSATAAALSRLASTERERHEMGARARHRVATRYGLESVVTRYLALLGLPARWPAAA